MQAYQLNFDFAQHPFHFDVWMLVIAIPIMGINAARSKRDRGGKATRVYSAVIAWWVGIMGIIVSLAFYASYFLQISSTQAAIKRGDVSTVEGCLQGFHAAPKGWNGGDRFSVGGRQFAYSDSVVNACFHREERYGGPIHADTRVRVTFSGDCIVRLETMQKACPRAPDLPAQAPTD